MAQSPFKKRTDAEQWNIDRPRIHALKNKAVAKNPGFNDDNYRDIILDISNGKCSSSTDLSRQQRQELISRLSMLAGETSPTFQSRRGPGGGYDKRTYPKRPKNMDNHGQSRDEQLKKIEALLTVGKKEWPYADGIARKICKVDKVQWVETHALYKIIAALTYQAKREGWDLSGAK